MSPATNCLPRLIVSLTWVAVATLFMLGCTTSSQLSGGYYGGDRPPQNVPVNLDAIAEAVPRHEPLSITGNKPYIALGKLYQPLAAANGYIRRGTASWYGNKFHGQPTSSGEPYNMFAMTAAHTLLPLPSYARVTNLENGKSVVVKINDRGPFLHNRLIDLSYAAAYRLGIIQHGTGRVEVRAISHLNSLPSTAPQPISVPTNEQTIFLQIGAYAHRENAHSMRQRLERAGYQVAPWSDNRPQNQKGQYPVYRVQVGPFTNHHLALADQQKLEAMLGHTIALVFQ